jgi:NADPH:quinone reductase-like Zn-dependent oxidoreductase
MPKAVRLDDYGGVAVLEVRDVPRPVPAPDQVLVAVRAAGINPSEGKMRAGLVREIFPLTFPSGEGRAAFTELEAGHVAGKIVLIPDW